MARFYYARTHREVEIPDEIADEYDGRKHYTRLTAPPLEVPGGTIGDVLAWVGADPARAELALEAELAGKRRKTLVDALEQV